MNTVPYVSLFLQVKEKLPFITSTYAAWSSNSMSSYM